MESIDIREMSGLVLAYLGDTVWETQIRLYWVKKGFNISHLNYKVKQFVNAKAQSHYYQILSVELSEEEKAIMRRAKNAGIRSFPKSCSNQEYREATAFEAIIGAWFLQGNIEKIESFRNRILEKNKGE